MLAVPHLTFLLSVIGIFLIGALPFSFTGTQFQISKYISGLNQLIYFVFNPSEISYSTVMLSKRPLFPEVLTPYLYSMTILTMALIIALLLGVCSASLLYLSKHFRDKIKILLLILESIPDILIAVIFQFFIIWFYKNTDILLFQIASSYNEESYFIPVLTLSILPTILFTNVTFLNIEQEVRKDYFEIVKAKGFSDFYVILHHVIPNTLISLFYNSKLIFWYMLSNLLVIEYIFNINGIMNFLYTYGTPEVFTVCILMIFSPLFIFFSVGHWLIGRRGESYEAS